MSLFKKYIPIGDSEDLKLKLSISFHKGGTNWATSVEIPAGYRGHIIPVKIEKGDGYQMETMGSFTGFSVNLLNAGRQSAKRLQAAIDLMEQKSQEYYDHWKEHFSEDYFEEEIKEEELG